MLTRYKTTISIIILFIISLISFITFIKIGIDLKESCLYSKDFFFDLKKSKYKNLSDNERKRIIEKEYEEYMQKESLKKDTFIGVLILFLISFFAVIYLIGKQELKNKGYD